MKIACTLFGLVLLQCGALYANSVSSSSSSSSDGNGNYQTQQSSNIDGIEQTVTTIGDDYGDVTILDDGGYEEDYGQDFGPVYGDDIYGDDVYGDDIYGDDVYGDDIDDLDY